MLQSQGMAHPLKEESLRAMPASLSLSQGLFGGYAQAATLASASSIHDQEDLRMDSNPIQIRPCSDDLASLFTLGQHELLSRCILDGRGHSVGYRDRSIVMDWSGSARASQDYRYGRL